MSGVGEALGLDIEGGVGHQIDHVGCFFVICACVRNEKRTCMPPTFKVYGEVDPVLARRVCPDHGFELGLLRRRRGRVEERVQANVRVVCASLDVTGLQARDDRGLESRLADDADLAVRELHTRAATGKHAKHVARVLWAGEQGDTCTLAWAGVAVEAEMERCVGKGQSREDELGGPRVVSGLLAIMFVLMLRVECANAA